MLTTKPTAEMIIEWRRIYNDYRNRLYPNRKTGEQVNNYFIEKYRPEKFGSDKFSNVVIYNIMENEHNKEKLPLGVVPNIVTYKKDDIIIGIDLITGFFHIEGKDIKAVSQIYDDLFLYRGLDEKDLNNYFLVAQYIQLKQAQNNQ